jgi:hypothetical protein
MLMDTEMSGPGGTEDTCRLLVIHSRVRVLMVIMFENDVIDRRVRIRATWEQGRFRAARL